MKKLLLILICSFGSQITLRCMEQSSEQRRTWHDLPLEMQVLVFSEFSVTDTQDYLKLLLVNKEFHRLAKELCYIKFYRLHAHKEILKNDKKAYKRFCELVTQGQLDEATCFVDAGIDLKMVDGEQSPLISALQNGHKKIAVMLIENGIDVNAHPIGKATALILAVGKNDKELVELLLEKNADPKVRFTSQKTALMHVASLPTADKEIAELLLDHGAEIDACDATQKTALAEAALNGHTQLVELLLARKANAHIATKSGMTPLKYAQKYQHDDVVRLLQKYLGL